MSDIRSITSNIEELLGDQECPIQNAVAIQRCLEYLKIEAERAGLTFSAHVIGVAVEAVADSVRLSERSQSHREPDQQRLFRGAPLRRQ